MANEKRLKLIDYDEIRTLFDEEYKKTAQLIRDGETHLDNLAEGFTEADRVIWKLPTVDAVEVVHGSWEYGRWNEGHWENGNERCRCSVCHRDFAVDNLNIWHGCPQCLAIMDLPG